MDDLADAQHVAELWRLIRGLGDDAVDPAAPPSARTSRGVVVAVGPGEPGSWHVSLSHEEADLTGLPRALGATAVTHRAAATHCTVLAHGPPPWVDGDYFGSGD